MSRHNSSLIGKIRLLDDPPARSLKAFCMLCDRVLGRAAALAMRGQALQSLAYYKADAETRRRLRPRQMLEARWYHALRHEGRADYAVYEGPDYVGDLWACWAIYSRGYLRQMDRPGLLPSGSSIIQDVRRRGIRSVVDLGCGFGYTTAALAQLFPEASVSGTNLDGTAQMALCRALAVRHGFSVCTDAGQIPEADRGGLLFASEYFEHFPAPVAHLDHVLSALKPRALLVANAFGAESIGHFDVYEIAGREVAAADVGRIWNARLRAAGYAKQRTGCWNGRPAYWTKTA
jgi:SAM-dependent methyltransferase